MNRQTALYARVSSEKQAQEKTIESQIEGLKEFASTRHICVDADLIFIDNGVSGATLIRPGLDALRDRCLNGEIERLLVLSPDRLARKSTHQLVLIEELKRLGVEVVFANHPVTDSPEDQLLLQIQGVIAEYEREKIRERSRRGLLHKAKQGKINVLRCAPYGYVYIRRTQTEDAKLIIHASDAKVVRRIFELYVREKLSLRKICSRLRDENIRAPKGGQDWDPSTVHGILNNPVYSGRAAFQRRESVERIIINKNARKGSGYPVHGAKSSTRWRNESEWILIKVPSIVDSKTFELAKAQNEENIRFAGRNNRRHEYLISGLGHCAECGYAICGIGASPPRKPIRYYRCLGMEASKRPQGRVCKQKAIHAEIIDDLVWDQVKNLILNPNLVLKEYTERINCNEKNALIAEKLVRGKEAEIRHQEHEKQRLFDLYQQGLVSIDEIKERLQTIRDKIQTAEAERGNLLKETEQQMHFMSMIDKFETFSQKLKANLDNLTFQEKQKIVRLLVKQIVIDRNKHWVKVQHVIPLQEMSKLCSKDQ